MYRQLSFISFRVTGTYNKGLFWRTVLIEFTSNEWVWIKKEYCLFTINCIHQDYSRLVTVITKITKLQKFIVKLSFSYFYYNYHAITGFGMTLSILNEWVIVPLYSRRRKDGEYERRWRWVTNPSDFIHYSVRKKLKTIYVEHIFTITTKLIVLWNIKKQFFK
jgi:hypothetical protein